MPFRGTARPALFLLLLGFVLYVPAYFWVNSRTFVPLDMPISLAPGRVQSPEFKINLEANFFVYARSDNFNDVCRYQDKLLTQSSVSAADQIVPVAGASIGPESHHVIGTYLGSFHAAPGLYRLNVEVFSQTGEYNRCYPHLQVEIGDSEYYEWQNPLSSLFTFCIFLEFIGVAMLFVFATTRSQSKSFEALKLRILPHDNPPTAELVRPVPSTRRRPLRLLLGILGTLVGLLGFVFADEPAIQDHEYSQLIFLNVLAAGLALLLAHRFARSQHRSRAKILIPALFDQISAWGITGLHPSQFSRRNPRPMNPATNLPSIALICALTCFVWFLPMFVIQMNRRVTSGLEVLLPSKNVLPPASLDGLTAPLVSIDAKGHVFLNYKPVTWDALPAELDRTLAVLPVRVVYFDGDPAISFMEAARAIDIIQGCRANAILVIPKPKRHKRTEQLPPM